MNEAYLNKNQKRTSWVVILTAVTMLIEIYFGISSGSMALLADGIHMGSHVLAIGLSWIAYVFVRKVSKKESYTGDSNKILSLSGYTSGLLLLIFAFVIIIEAVDRFINPITINFKNAILVAVIGLIVNILSAVILHHNHEQSDLNIKAAYVHVLADALTSLAAIFGLTAALIWDIPFIDAIAAVISSLVIIKWSIGLLKETGSVLLDIKQKKENK